MFGGGIRFGWGSGRWLIRPMQCVHARFSGVRGSPVADLLPEMLAGLATGSAVSLLQLCEGNSVGHSRGVMLPLHPPCRVAVLDLLCLQWVVIWVGHLRLLHMFLRFLIPLILMFLLYQLIRCFTVCAFSAFDVPALLLLMCTNCSFTTSHMAAFCFCTSR